MNVTLQQLEFFQAVARNLSFSNGAKELYTSQPYVSNQIRKLENHFGVPLFVRSYPQISLTEAGRALYERVSDIIDRLDQLEQVVQEFQGLERGSIQLAATESAGNHVMPELISGFHRQHPEIVVQMRVGNTASVVEWLSIDEAEIGISPRKPESKSLTAAPFYREPLIVIYPPDLELPDPLPVDRLAELPLVVREEGSLTFTRLTEALGEQRAEPQIVARLQGTTAVNEAVAAGLGVSLVPARSAKAWLDAGSVRKAALDLVDLRHDFYVVYAQQRYLTPAARAFIAHLLRRGGADS